MAVMLSGIPVVLGSATAGFCPSRRHCSSKCHATLARARSGQNCRLPFIPLPLRKLPKAASRGIDRALSQCLAIADRL
jgi:hypothetical protein